MGYAYDAFFSYKRDDESDDWHRRVKEKLAFWLKLNLGTPVNIFFDTKEIRTGEEWRDVVRDALKTSKCIVCVWSPLYFQSQWCLSEWQTFSAREEISHRTLVMPASYFDGKTFPPNARKKQFSDFSKYASTLPRFWDTEFAVEFENTALKPFADDLANLIRGAPTYSDTFPIVEVKEDDVQPPGAIGRPADE